MKSYQTARRVFGFTEFLAVLVVLAGIGIAIVGVMMTSQAAQYGRFPDEFVPLGLIPGAVIVFIGLFGIVMSQSARASVDTAELTGQILKVARDQLEVSKQSQRSTGRPVDFGQLADKTPQPENGAFADFAQNADAALHRGPGQIAENKSPALAPSSPDFASLTHPPASIKEAVRAVTQSGT